MNCNVSVFLDLVENGFLNLKYKLWLQPALKRNYLKAKKSAASATVVIISCVTLSCLVHSQWAFSAKTQSRVPKTLVQLLRDFQVEITMLPHDAFRSPMIVEQTKKTLCNDIEAAINQVNAGAYIGAISKLENDVKSKVDQRILDPWKTLLIDFVNAIIDAFGHYV